MMGELRFLGFIHANEPWTNVVLLFESSMVKESVEDSAAWHDPVKPTVIIAEAYRNQRDRQPQVRLSLDLKRQGDGRAALIGAESADPVPAGKNEGRNQPTRSSETAVFLQPANTRS